MTIQNLEKDLIEMNEKIIDYDRKLVEQTNILLYKNTLDNTNVDDKMNMHTPDIQGLNTDNRIELKYFNSD